ncbi:acyltransferase family protein [Propionibacteriaceae bacterium Y1700]|uniref:acyltransferase family protein n=1 Tax=Microlunatus sp. Y1700 TaxID=3418487 RepID=UPI003DA747E3
MGAILLRGGRERKRHGIHRSVDAAPPVRTMSAERPPGTMMIMTITATPAPTRSATRLHGLDALRAAALGLGIVLHSIMAFAPGLPWLITDSVTSGVVWLPMYWIHLFRMTVFMLLAGYFGRMVLHRRGPAAYVKDRLLRIGLPVVAFWPIAVLSLGILAAVGAAVRGVAPPAAPDSDVPELLMLFTPGQLWFLLVLLECAVITVVVRAVLIRVFGSDRTGRASSAVGGWLSSYGGVFLVAVSYVVCLLLQGLSAEGIIAPATVLPELPPLIAYLGAFLAGWFLQARPDGLSRVAAQWPVQLVGAVVLAVAGFLTTPQQIGLPAHALIIGLAGWTWTYALLGMSVRFLTRERPVVRYLADASYWAYLLHLPLLVAIEIPLADQPWPIMIKLIITWVVAGAVLLGIYDLFVRSTWIGQWLNGHRRPRGLRT